MADPTPVRVTRRSLTVGVARYGLDPQPQPAWFDHLRMKAAGRLTETRPPFGIEIATGPSAIEVSGVTDENAAAVDQMVESFVNSANERAQKDARRD